MTPVRYALREDPATINMLEDAGHYFKNYYQIITFHRNLIKPDYVGEYLYFAPFTGYNGKYSGDATPVKIMMEDKGWEPDPSYVAVIESEVEFQINSSVIRHLCKDYMPEWSIGAYLNYFSGRPSGLLVFLRVYKTNQYLDPKYLVKGSKGRFSVFKLYDEYENEVSFTIDGLKPVISDNKFDYLKDEIMHILKVDNAFIVKYDNTDMGLKCLSERFEADRKLRDTHQIWEKSHFEWKDGFDIDADDDFDMAQLDYDAIFDDAESVCPQMKPLIENFRGIQAARLGEYDYLLKDVHARNENVWEASLRIFDMSVRSAVKNALHTYQHDNMNFEDAFQEACLGIWMAILKHSDNVKGLFPSYASMWMVQVMKRDLPYYQQNCRIPVHYNDRVENIVAELQRKCGDIDFNELTPTELYYLLLKNTSCGNEDAERLSYLLIPAKSIEEMTENDEYDGGVSDHGQCMEKVIDSLSMNDITDSLDVLKNRERDVIRLRYGFNDGQERTLEEVGRQMHVTRERVRQIEKKALRKLRQPNNCKKFKEF